MTGWRRKLSEWYDGQGVMRFRARYGATVCVGGTIFAAFVILDRGVNLIDVSERTISPAVRGDLFGSFIDVCALLLTVFLAVLSVVTTLAEDRPVVRVMKKELKNYDELIHRLVGPVPTILLLGVASIACLMVGDGPKGDADRGWLMLLPSATLAIAGGLLFQTASVARLLGKVLLFRPRSPPTSSSPDVVAQRLEELRAANAASADGEHESGAGLEPKADGETPPGLPNDSPPPNKAKKDKLRKRGK